MASDWLAALLAANQKLHLKIVVNYPCFYPWIALVGPTPAGWHRSNIHIGIMGQLAWHAITWKKTTSTCLPLKIHIMRPRCKTWLEIALVPAQLITSITL